MKRDPDLFWSGPTPPPPSRPLVPVYLDAIQIEDHHGTRNFEIWCPRVLHICDWQNRSDGMRYYVEIDVVDMRDSEMYSFGGKILWAAIMRDALIDYHPDRFHAMMLMTRERVVEYLASHPYPEYGFHGVDRMNFEIA